MLATTSEDPFPWKLYLLQFSNERMAIYNNLLGTLKDCCFKNNKAKKYHHFLSKFCKNIMFSYIIYVIAMDLLTKTLMCTT